MYHRDRSLENQKNDDESKRKLCQAHNVVLIEVPYDVSYKNMGTFIVEECKKKSVSVPPLSGEIDYVNFGVFSSNKFKELQEYCRNRGGKCLSKAYLGARTKLRFRCSFMHEWETAPHEITRGRWCPICAIKTRADKARLTLADAQKLAKQNGGLCLSACYVDSQSKLEWTCAKGHRWLSAYTNVASGCWCPYCAGHLKSNIGEMKKLAKEKGGSCLSDVYVSNHSKLQWKCARGHIWWAEPASIRSMGSWCLVCAGKAKHTIGDMQTLVEKKGGRCLSKEYVNRRTKLLWRCKEGHEWMTSPLNVLSGCWCPKCSDIRVADTRRANIDEMQKLAERRGGKCLSEKYTNNNTKLKWQCKEGHMWVASPLHVKHSRSWCPTCAGKRTKSSLISRVKKRTLSSLERTVTKRTYALGRT